MKNLTIFVLFFFPMLYFSQVAIGKSTVSNASISLEFGVGNRGLILPWVDNTAGVSSVVNGTIVYDTSDKKVKVKYASGWKDLSVDTTGVVDTSAQSSLTELSNAKTSIGTPTAVAGILVLEDTDKAMVLPKVADPHLNIINPAPGMIVFDTNKKELCVFNGTVWTFWKQ